MIYKRINEKIKNCCSHINILCLIFLLSTFTSCVTFDAKKFETMPDKKFYLAQARFGLIDQCGATPPFLRNGVIDNIKNNALLKINYTELKKYFEQKAKITVDTSLVKENFEFNFFKQKKCNFILINISYDECSNMLLMDYTFYNSDGTPFNSLTYMEKISGHIPTVMDRIIAIHTLHFE